MKRILQAATLVFALASFACGEFSSGLSGGKKLSELSDDEKTQFCEAAHEFTTSESYASIHCLYLAYNIGNMSEDMKKGSGERVCNNTYDECLKTQPKLSEVGEHSCQSNWNCSATVREAEQCVNDSFDTFKKHVEGLSCKPDSWKTWQKKQLELVQQESDADNACTAVQKSCG